MLHVANIPSFIEISSTVTTRLSKKHSNIQVNIQKRKKNKVPVWEDPICKYKFEFMIDIMSQLR